MNTTERKKPVTLTLEKKARIVRWLNEQHEWLAGRPSFAEATRRCQADVDFPIGEHSVRDIARAFGIAWDPLVSTGRKAAGRLRREVEALIGRVEVLEKASREAALHADIIHLRDMVSNLYSQLGAKLPLPTKPVHNGVADRSALTPPSPVG